MKKFCSVAVIALLALANGTTPVRADSQLFDYFNGAWIGKGSLFGAPAKFEMTWERALNDKFMKLKFMNNFQASKGNDRTLLAEGFYKMIDDTSGVGTWHDSRGMILQLKFTLNDSALTVEWSANEVESGRTVYRKDAGDTIEVTDYVLKAGELQKFGEARYVRVEKESAP